MENKARDKTKDAGDRRSRRKGPTRRLEALSNIDTIAAIEAEQRAKAGLGQRVAEGISRFCGSITFACLNILVFVGWILLNTLSDRYSVDPFPFTFLTFIVSLEAILLSVFILISQNHETRLAERRNHLDLQVNLLAEQESTKTLELLQLVAKRLGVECEDDEDTKALLEPVDPKVLVDAIIEASSPEESDPVETSSIEESKPPVIRPARQAA